MMHAPIRQPAGASPVFPLLLATGAATCIGLLLGSGFALLLGLGVIVLGIIPLLYFSAKGITDTKGRLLVIGWCLMLISHLGSQWGLPLGYLMELILFGLALGILRRVWQLSHDDKQLRIALMLWGIYLAVTLLSSLMGRSHKLAMIWQLQYNLKWPLMFGLGLMVAWGEQTDRILRLVLQTSWLFIVACLILEITAPGVHSKLFGPPPDLHVNPFLGTGHRYCGPFIHSGYLATTCALLAAGTLARVLGGENRAWLLLTALYTLCVILSGQRQEFAALLLVFALFATIMWSRYWYLLAISALALGGAAITGLAYLKHLPLEDILAQWGLTDGLAALSERAVLTEGGLRVANQYFPLGSGLGTYGGVGAQKFDQSLFVHLGFGRYWWFRQGLFLVDTYWPSILAESGYLGGAALLAFFLHLWRVLVARATEVKNSPLFAPALTAVAGLTIMLANSPSSSAITDPRGAFVFWLLAGSLWQATYRRRASPPNPSHFFSGATPISTYAR